MNPRKSKEQLKVSGMDKRNPGRYSDMENVPDAELISTLTCPAKYHVQTKRAWKQMIPTLQKLGVISEQDITTVMRMMDLLDVTNRATDRIYEALAEDDLDKLERWSNIRLKNWDACSKIMYRYGITPVERTKLQVPEKKAENPMEAILKVAQ